MTDTEQSHLNAKNSGEQRPNLFLLGSLCVFLICYVGVAIRSAASTPLWMDEVLSVWVIRLPSASRIYSALAHGAEFSPPAFHLALHYYSKIAGDSYLALRLPSIAAILVTGACSFAIFRRSLGTAPAIFACCLLLKTLFPFAVQVRPYALVTCCFALALFLWDSFNRRPAWWRCLWIGLLLAFAVSLHFYSVLFIPCFGVMELIHLVRTRKFRLPMWIALFAAGASIFPWLPLIHVLGQYNAGDTSSPAYYAKPSLSRLIAAYSDLAFPGTPNILLVLTALAAVAAGRFRGVPAFGTDEKDRGSEPDFWTLIFGTALLPLIAFLFSLAVTKTFNERYAVAAAIAISALVAGGFSDSLPFRRAVPLIALLAALLMIGHQPSSIGDFDRAAAFQHLPGPYPIVIADGVQFFPLAESAPADIRPRLVYLTLPPGVPVADPTNQHQIERWKAIDPGLPVEDVSGFLGSHPKFYVLDTKSSDDAPATWLLSRHLIEFADQAGGALIYKSRLSPESGRW